MSVVLTDLVKEFQDAQGLVARAVDGVSLSVDKGELVTLLGPSGCGKTTTLRMIAGFETPTAGSIRIGSRDVTHVPPFRRNIPMVFQSYALFPHLNVRANAAFGLEMAGVAPAEIDKRVAELAESMHLGGLLDRAPHELSGGQQQRVALLRALVTNPEVLLFDEPLSNLDAQMRVGVRAEIRSLQKRLGITAVYVTHDQGEAMAISDRIVVMHRGRIAQAGPPALVYRRPVNRFVASFLGEAHFAEVRVVGRDGTHVTVDGPLGSLCLPSSEAPHLATVEIGQVLDLVVRPEMVRLVGEGHGVGARVRRCTYFGGDASCELSVDGLEVSARLFAPDPAKLPADGALVRIAVDQAAVQVLPRAVSG